MTRPGVEGAWPHDGSRSPTGGAWRAAVAGGPVPAREQRDRRVGRPVLALVLLGCLFVVVLGVISGVVGGTGLVVGAVLALLPVVVVVRCYLWLDRWEPEPPHLLRVALVWGAGPAALLAVVLNSAAVELAAQALGPDDADALGAVVVAPVVEEAAKGAVLLWCLWRHRHEVDGILDGLVLAGMVGVGFAFTENVLYFGRAFVLGIDDSGLLGGFLVTTSTFVMRGVLAPFAHPLFTSMLGVGIGIAATTRSRGVARLAVLAGFVGAVVLHALWNGAAVMAGDGFARFYLAVMVPVFLAAVAVAVWSRRREGRLVAHHLPAYAAAGWLAPYEVGLLASQRSRRQLMSDAERAGGARRARTTQTYHALATELCFLRERLARDRAGDDGEQRQAQLLLGLARARTGAQLQPLPVRPVASGGWAPPSGRMTS
jgi:RsiW-degrading membrane proteinase PrsW (M82 family)